MRRLVVAVTALLTMVGAVVVVGYLLLFSAVTDRAAGAAPGDTAIYLNLYLQPSSGQKMNLIGLIGHLPGFRDAATVEDKIDEVAQRLLGLADIDYGADLRPWLGEQVAIAIGPAGSGGAAPRLLLLAVVKDPAAAREGVPRLMSRDGVTYERETYRGEQMLTSDGTSYALLDDLLVVAASRDQLRAALDANADAAPSLADSAAFGAAMRTVPADHIASLYVDLGLLAGADPGDGLGGYTTAALALTAQTDGMHLDGSAPFAATAASDEVRAAFELGSQPAGLTAWMPRDTRAELVIFGLHQSLADLETQMAGAASFAEATTALNQLRAIAAIGLGISLDDDLLPLFDGESALAVTDLDLATLRGQLLLRPSDAGAAQAALDRMRAALADRGSKVTTGQAAGTTITSITVPEIGAVSYAMQDGVVVLALDAEDVAAALEAHAAGDTLAGDERYTAAFELATGHEGNELWADIPGLTDAATTILDPGTELRDILHQIGELAMSASASRDHLEIHGVLTVK